MWQSWKNASKKLFLYAINYSQFFLFVQFFCQFFYFMLQENTRKPRVLRELIMVTLTTNVLTEIWSLIFACFRGLKNIFSLDKNEIHWRETVKYLMMIGLVTVSYYVNSVSYFVRNIQMIGCTLCQYNRNRTVTTKFVIIWFLGAGSHITIRRVNHKHLLSNILWLERMYCQAGIFV